MPYIDISFEPLPLGAKGRQVKYRIERDESRTAQPTKQDFIWTELADRFRSRVLKSFIATDKTVIVRSTVWDENDKLHIDGADDARFSPPTVEAVKPVPKPEDTSNVQVTQDETDTAIDVDAPTPKDERNEDYELEVRTSPTTVTDPKDALQITRRPYRFRCGCRVKVPICPDLEGDKQRVWIRYIRENDRKPGEWSSYDVELQEGERQDVTVKDRDESDGFSSGTMGETYGREELETNVNALRFRALEPIFNAVWDDQSIFGMDSDIPIWGMDVYMPRGTYEEAAVDAGAGNSLDVIVQMYPKLNTGSFVRPVQSIFGICSPFRFFPRTVELNLQDPEGEQAPIHSSDDHFMFAADNSGRRDPFLADQEIATSEDASVYTPFGSVEPGRKLKLRAYKAKVTMHNPLGDIQLELTDWFVYRRYRNRKWEFITPYTHSGNGELDFTIPEACRPRIVQPVIKATLVEDIEHPIEVTYTAEVLSYTPSTGVVTIRGKQVEEFTSGAISSDLWGTVTFKRAFDAAPRCVITPHEATLKAAGGIDSDLLSATAVSGYSKDIDGGTTLGTVQGEAKGIPIGDGSTNLELHIIVTGA